MAEQNQQQDIGSKGKISGSQLVECSDVQLTTSGADLIISAVGADTLTTEVMIAGTSCQSTFVCVWDGHKWVCT
jgi:hypothetical protein